MLWLHCGWPRTGTSSLQAAFSARRDCLAEAGFLYAGKGPEYAPASRGWDWAELFVNALTSSHAMAKLKRNLAGTEADVVMSTEAVTFFLVENRHDDLLRVLDAVSSVVPTRCIFTVRRLDRFAESLYLWWLARQESLPPPDTFFADVVEPHIVFERMAGIASSCELTCVRYEPSGAHNNAILRILGISPSLRKVLGDDLDRARLNRSLSHKQVATLLNVTALSSALEAELDGAAVRQAFRDGFEFHDDSPCRLLGGDARRALHERALEDARRSGFIRYAEFFAGDTLDEPDEVELGLDAIGRDDLSRLESALGLV